MHAKNGRVSCNKEAYEVRGVYARSMHRIISNRRIFTELTRSNGQALTRALDPNPRSPANQHTRITGSDPTADSATIDGYKHGGVSDGVSGVMGFRVAVS